MYNLTQEREKKQICKKAGMLTKMKRIIALKGLVKVKVILFKRPYLRQHQIRKPHNLVCPRTFGRRGFLSKTPLVFVLSAVEGQKKDSNTISVIVE